MFVREKLDRIFCIGLFTIEFQFTIWGALMLVAAQRLAQAKGNDEIEEDEG